MKTLSILTLTITLFTACQSNPAVPITQEGTLKVEKKKSIIQIPDDSTQLIVVSTKSWNAKNGTLQRYEKKDKKWEKFGEPISIILGRNGLGWGEGLHATPNNAPYIKKEGDGKAPAGLFSLGNGFGYNSFNIDFPYSTYQTTDHCVDDSQSNGTTKL